MLKIFASEEPPGRGLISHRPAVLIPAALRLFARRHPVAHYQRDLRFEAIEKRGIKYLFKEYKRDGKSFYDVILPG
jgi:hypothetical protein